MAVNIQEIAGVFNNAKAVMLELEGKKYSGEIEDVRIGEFVLFKVNNIDGTLVSAPPDFDGVVLNVEMLEGGNKRYPTRIVQKKLPQILLAFPKKEFEGVKRPPRRFLNIETPLILKAKENSALTMDMTGIGTMSDLSEGGCAVVTATEMEEEDRLHMFLNLSEPGKTMVFEVEAVVRRVIPQPDGINNYGVQFVSLDGAVVEAIKNFLKRHPVEPG